MNWKPQVMMAILALLILGIMGILFVPDQIEILAGACITGIGMLGMKLLE